MSCEHYHKAGEFIREKELVLITEHGKPSAYLVDVDHFEQIQQKLKLLEGLARGEKAILGELVVSPCRVFYREENDIVFIIHVIRVEQLLRIDLLKSR